MTKEFKVYQAKHVPTGKVYIGMTGSPLLSRIGQHLAVPEYKRESFQHFLHTTEYSEWQWEVLYVVADAAKAYTLESEIIRDMQLTGAELLNTTGVVKTKPDPTWLKPHQFPKGHENWNKGKSGVYSDETIQKMRMAKLRNPVRNAPSPEQIQHIKSTQGKPVMCVETGIEYQSVGDAAKAHNTGRNDIRRVIQGKRGHIAGYTFKFVEKQTNKDS